MKPAIWSVRGSGTPAGESDPLRRSAAGRSAAGRSPVLRRAAVAVVAAVSAAGLTSATASQAGADTGPAMSVVAASPTATLTRYVYPDGAATMGQIGIYAVAGTRGIQFRITRAAYDRPVKAAAILGSGKTATTIALPDGLVTDFNGLERMFVATVRDAAGATVVSFPVGFCPSYGAVRTTMSAPESTTIPHTCGGSHFSLGVLVGLAPDWATPLLNWDERFRDLEVGEYTLTVGLTPEWKAGLGLGASAATTMKLSVVRAPDSGAGGPSGTPTSSARGVSPAARAAGQPPVAPAIGDGAALAEASDLGMVARPGRGLRPAQQDELNRTRRLRSAAARPGTPVDRGGSRAVVSRAQLSGSNRKNLPDLVPLPAFSITVSPFTDPEQSAYGGAEGREYLSFSATVWNKGPSPLVVDGLRLPGADVMSAYQSLYDASGKRIGYADTGEMAYDPRPGHEHWHFKDFAEYRLVDASGELAIPSEKEAFCLAPTDAIDLTVKGALVNPDSVGLGGACGQPTSLGIREVLPSGWGDTYGQWLPGQAFDVTTLPNGTYYIEVVTNPAGRLLERDTTNNLSRRQVILGGTKGARTVTVPPYQGIDTEQPTEPGVTDAQAWRFGR